MLELAWSKQTAGHPTGVLLATCISSIKLADLMWLSAAGHIKLA